ncbi:MAG TPA: hypothetical protein VL201_01315, partial [Patescibacteria group bacterium]|nr:hypothetical protein [Patescibacteria group bacterium]
RTAFFNLLHAYIILTDEERMEKYNQLKGDIIKKLLKGVSSNEWHEIETRFIRGNKHYLLNNNPFIITEERIGQSNPIQNPIEKYFFMKK